jgi:paraquat-inducible protein B
MTQTTDSPETAQDPSASAGEPVSSIHQPVIKPYRQARWSWIWLVPLVAALVGLSLLVRTWMHVGPTVVISFESAEGLEVGQTKVRYKDVVVGQVTDLKVSPDRTRVLVSVQLDREGADYITQSGTRFWVVRPRLGVSGVSGLGTLLSGAYIAVDTRSDKISGDPVYEFTGLETPPEITTGRPGTRYTLISPDLGSLDIGSPVYYRRIPVGQVIGYSLDENGRSVHVQIFVDAPNDKFVTTASRFWNASGFQVNLGTDGVHVQTESLVSVLAGGIAFASVDDAETKPAEADTQFDLAVTKEKAMADPDGPPFVVEFHFPQSVRGLKVGAPVDFRGLELGKVIDIDLQLDHPERRLYARVRAELYPLRFGAVYDELTKGHKADGVPPARYLLGPLVNRGLRGQLRASNLLTGQQYVALDFFPKENPVAFDADVSPAVLPTIPGSFDRLQQQITGIVAKLDAVPFDTIGNELNETLKSTAALMKKLNGSLAPDASKALKAAEQSLARLDRLLSENSPVTTGLQSSMLEISQAAKSLRALADYLQSNPSVIIHGRPAERFPVQP